MVRELPGWHRRLGGTCRHHLSGSSETLVSKRRHNTEQHRSPRRHENIKPHTEYAIFCRQYVGLTFVRLRDTRNAQEVYWKHLRVILKDFKDSGRGLD